ncbi:hypothetical protein [Actinotalea fermentans]|uniref:Uncharacterized protein n=1 Tax=Actinotalea fermentans TaxID=43671 RepID=A0A511Z0S4_9CELL|nr:hypothetical protein [Actinotalea fermentans]GEN81039.1 hypothetical protein AFE02nite_27730 [Actinotalea fermentans]
MSAAAPGVPVWWLRTATVELVTLHAVASSERPDGTVVDVVSLPPGYAPRGEGVVRARVRPATRQVLEVEVCGDLADGRAPALVWHEQLRRDLRPVEAQLRAFSHDDVARLATERPGPAVDPAVDPGVVLTDADVERLGLAPGDAIAVLRWNPATGQVLELQVDRASRRRRVATCLLAAAEACAVARGWPILWAGGERTALGESLLRGLRWGVRRARPLTVLAPPTAPAGARAGRRAARVASPAS